MKNTISIKKDLTPLLRLAIPLALTGFVQSAVWFFETIFLAHLGTDSLAAGSLAGWLFGTIAVILFGILSAINILVAHKHGANDPDGIAIVARDGLYLSVMLVIPSFIIFRNISPIFSLFGQSESIVALAKTYLHAISWGLFGFFLAMSCLEVIMGLGRARVILIYNIISMLFNIFWSYVLIFGKFGFSAYGVAGAGWGWTVSTIFSAIMLFIYILSTHDFRSYFRLCVKLAKPVYLIELIQIGLPMGLMFCVEVGFFLVLTLCAGLLGSRMQAANQVALQYLNLFMSVMFALAQAVTVRMGHLIGAKQYDDVKNVNVIGVSIAAILMSLVAVVYWLFPALLITIDFDVYNPANSQIVNDIKEILVVSAIFQIIEGVRITLFGSLRALKDTRFTLLISILSFWCIALPIGYLLGIYLHFGGAGFWWGMVLGTSLSVMLLQWRFNRLVKTKSHLI